MSLSKKAWLLLKQEQKKYAFFIFILMFFAMILEALSVGVILPLISVLLKCNIDFSIFSSEIGFPDLKATTFYISAIASGIHNRP